MPTFSITDECSSLGAQYLSILDKCYYFEKTKKTPIAAQSNCKGIFGPNSHGKLVEPTTMAIFNKIVLSAREKLSNDNFYVGIEKIDNAGNLKYSSNGKRIPTQFWNGASLDVSDGMDQSYLGYYPSQVKWHDAPATRELVSVCENENTITSVDKICENIGLYHKIDNITSSLQDSHQDSKGKSLLLFSFPKLYGKVQENVLNCI